MNQVKKFLRWLNVRRNDTSSLLSFSIFAVLLITGMKLSSGLDIIFDSVVSFILFCFIASIGVRIVDEIFRKILGEKNKVVNRFAPFLVYVFWFSIGIVIVSN